MSEKKSPLTSTEKVRALRERRAAEGATEIRGLYAPTHLHPAIKAMIRAFVEAQKPK